VATQGTTTRGQTEAAPVARLVPAQSVMATGPAVPLGVLFFGAVAVVAAVWGAAAPFAGPDFGFVADRSSAWQWSVTSACLGLGPGAVALVASLWVVGVAPRTSYGRRADLWVLGLVVTVCGTWFVVGQYVWPVVYGERFIAPSSATQFLWEEIAFAIGPGVVLACCGAAFMGWAVRRQLVLVAAQFPPAAGTGEAAAAAAPPAAGTGEAAAAAPPAAGTGEAAAAPPAAGTGEPPTAGIALAIPEPPPAGSATPPAEGAPAQES
jgi:hypothetical protein